MSKRANKRVRKCQIVSKRVKKTSKLKRYDNTACQNVSKRAKNSFHVKTCQICLTLAVSCRVPDPFGEAALAASSITSSVYYSVRTICGTLTSETSRRLKKAKAASSLPWMIFNHLTKWVVIAASPDEVEHTDRRHRNDNFRHQTDQSRNQRPEVPD